MTIDGSLSVSGYGEITSFEYDSVTLEFNENATGEFGDLPLTATGTITVDGDSYQMSSVMPTILHSMMFGFMTEGLLEGLGDFIDSVEERITESGFSMAWTDKDAGEIRWTITSEDESELDVTIRGALDITVDGNIETGPITVGFDGALGFTGNGSFVEYLGFENTEYTWDELGEYGPDGPPDETSGSVVVDTKRYDAVYLVEVMSVLMELTSDDEV